MDYFTTNLSSRLNSIKRRALDSVNCYRSTNDLTQTLCRQQLYFAMNFELNPIERALRTRTAWRIRSQIKADLLDQFPYKELLGILNDLEQSSFESEREFAHLIEQTLKALEQLRRICQTGRTWDWPSKQWV